MSCDRRRYFGWFLALIAFFVAVNLAGLVRPMALKPFRAVGFPLTWSAWGLGIEPSIDGAALAVDGLVAVSASALIAWLCTIRFSTGPQSDMVARGSKRLPS
jgi:hypothetical protein